MILWLQVCVFVREIISRGPRPRPNHHRTYWVNFSKLLTVSSATQAPPYYYVVIGSKVDWKDVWDFLKIIFKVFRVTRPKNYLICGLLPHGEAVPPDERLFALEGVIAGELKLYLKFCSIFKIHFFSVTYRSRNIACSSKVSWSVAELLFPKNRLVRLAKYMVNS